MYLFNSLGSNYNFKSVLTMLLAGNSSEYQQKLKKFLAEKYNAEVHLFYKGREAIEAALRMSGIPAGSFVAINGFTCFAVYNAVKNSGLKPLYLDIDKETLNFENVNLEKLLEKNRKIKAVIVQHTLGNSADTGKLSEICKKYKVLLIEDMAHSSGGNHGDFVALSFSQDKIIDSVSGGALIIRNKTYRHKTMPVTKEVKLAQQLKDRFYPLITYIIRVLYPTGAGKILHYIFKHLNLMTDPMGEIQTGMRSLPGWYAHNALNYLIKLPEDIKHRNQIASVYSKNLDNKVKLSGNFIMRYPIIVKNRQDLVSRLKKRGVYVSDIWFDAPVAPKKMLKDTDYKGQCPIAEAVSDNILNLPTHKNITQADALEISSIINRWINTK